MNFGDLIANVVQSNMGFVLVTLGFVILLFIAVREILCWYWKTSEIVDLLKDIGKEIQTTNAILRRIAPSEKAVNGPLRTLNHSANSCFSNSSTPIFFVEE